MDNVTRLLMQGAAGAAGGGTYVDDVFSTYLYKGTSINQPISNGVKLGNSDAGNGVKFSGSTKGESEIDKIVIVSFCRVQRTREDPEGVPPDKVGGCRS